jgi:hypothetical protein
LARFALAVQFYLSFGHIHPEDIYGPAEVTLPAGVWITLPVAQALRAIPADQTLGHADELCPICEAMYSLATSSVPTAPEIAPVTFAMRSVEHLFGIEAPVVALRRAPFQSRAPPPAGSSGRLDLATLPCTGAAMVGGLNAAYRLNFTLCLAIQGRPRSIGRRIVADLVPARSDDVGTLAH